MAAKTDVSPSRDVDTSNHFGVAASGRMLTILRPPFAGAALSDVEAANLAAWLAALVICSSPSGRALFDETLAAILRS